MIRIAESNQHFKQTSTPLVDCDHVTIQLGGRTILSDVNAQIWPGEFVGIIGPNASGKSTLLRALLGLIRPAKGQIRFQGMEVRRGIARVGYSPQSHAFDRDLPITGRDFVALGVDGNRWGIGFPSAANRQRVDEVLCAVGAQHLADAPLGRLSGGEQQRLSIAQALLGEPSLLILDEPLANLDVKNQGEIVELVDRIRRERGMAVLFVTHEVNPILKVVDRVWYLAGGRATIGRASDVIRSDVLSRLYGSRVDVIESHGHVFVLAIGD